MSDTSKDSDKKPSSPAEKKRLARSEVRNALRDQRAKLRELRQGMRSGQDLSDDIDSCSGEDENLRVLVLKLLHAHHLDATSVLALEELLDYLKEKNCHVLLCEVRRDAFRILRDSGVMARINRKNVFPHTVSNPTLSTAKAIKRAKELVAGMNAKVTIYSEQNKV